MPVRRVSAGEVSGNDERARLNRELIELLNELRVALPGVQVLFAFLLTIPFAKGFPKLGELDRHVYFLALLATLLSTALLITPSAYHRFTFRQEQLLETSNKLTIAGLAVIAVAISCSMFVITDFLFGSAFATVIAVGTFLVFAMLWYALPLSRRAKTSEAEKTGQ